MRSGLVSRQNVQANVIAESPRKVCIIPRLEGVGGMVSFQHKLIDGLKARNIDVCLDLNDNLYQAVLVVGGTRDLPGLLKARRRGIPIVQRLDGMNWLHRLSGFQRTGLHHYMRAEYGNMLLALIRKYFASQIVYQSEFSRRWWERVRGISPIPNFVIYNGVDLNIYSPNGSEKPPLDHWRVLMVEGSLMGGYEMGVAVAIDMVTQLSKFIQQKYPSEPPNRIELKIVGRVHESLRDDWNNKLSQMGASAYFDVSWVGLVGRHQIPAIDRAAHLLYSSDIHPACPNAVIEALACGLPVVSFDTGSLSEIVVGGAGKIVPYGGDPWKLDPPDTAALAIAAFEVLNNQPDYRTAARRQAEDSFNLERMVEEYLNVLLPS